MAVYRSARNQKPQTLPKNMSPVDYKLATGLEALLGYLFVTEQDERLMELLQMSIGLLKREE
jgi:ribonuclease-3 family protein